MLLGANKSRVLTTCSSGRCTNITVSPTMRELVQNGSRTEGAHAEPAVSVCPRARPFASKRTSTAVVRRRIVPTKGLVVFLRAQQLRRIKGDSGVFLHQ